MLLLRNPSQLCNNSNTKVRAGVWDYSECFLWICTCKHFCLAICKLFSLPEINIRFTVLMSTYMKMQASSSDNEWDWFCEYIHKEGLIPNISVYYCSCRSRQWVTDLSALPCLSIVYTLVTAYQVVPQFCQPWRHEGNFWPNAQNKDLYGSLSLYLHVCMYIQYIRIRHYYSELHPISFDYVSNTTLARM